MERGRGKVRMTTLGFSHISGSVPDLWMMAVSAHTAPLSYTIYTSLLHMCSLRFKILWKWIGGASSGLPSPNLLLVNLSECPDIVCDDLSLL